MKTNTHWPALLCIVLLVAIPATTLAGYIPDKIVPLPDEPYPDCTNKDSGQVMFGQEYGEYIVVVENKLRMENWKEWAITYKITPTDENWYFDPHIDYSEIDDPTGGNQVYERLREGNYGAWWDTGVWGPNNPEMPLTWTAIGFPAGNPNAGQIVMTMFPNADYPFDTMPFDWNPEWVSLEFAGQNVTVDYEFIDWCIPEPASLSLLGLGVLLLRKRKA